MVDPYGRGRRLASSRVEHLVQANALLFGRVTYEMMEAAWRPSARTGARPDWMEPFVHPRLAGHGPTLFAGLSKRVDLKLVSRLECGSGRRRCGMSREGSHWN